MADAAFRWARHAGEARRRAEEVHERVALGTVAAFSVLIIGLAIVAVRRVLQTVPLPQVAPRQRANGPQQQPLVYGQQAPQQNPWGERSA